MRRFIMTLRFFSVFFLSITLSFSLNAEEQQQLAPEDVHKVMNQIFSQHVNKKRISKEILRNSFRIYVDQFDPDRIYLLDQEIRPFYHMSDRDLNRVMREYRNNNYGTYQRLNGLIQHAIERARNNRYQLNSKDLAFFDHEPQTMEQMESDLPGYFASNEAQLFERQKLHIRNFVDSERRRFGEGSVKKREPHLLAIYNKNIEEHENEYLFRGRSGRELSAAEKQNVFILHVIKSLAKSLDAHTSFFNQSEAYDMRVRLEKGFDGIGIILKPVPDGYEVARLLPNSPAKRSGLVQLRDQIVSVDGKDITSQPISRVMEMLRGRSGSVVSLALKRDDVGGASKMLLVNLLRESITIDEGRVETSYESFGNGIVGTIKLHAFYQGKNGVSSEDDVRRAIRELQGKGNLRGLILDLRDNSGGFLTQAVKVAGLFITNGVIVVSKYSNGEERYYRDMDGKVSYSGPLVVLTSRGTASAAEIVAQALQDYGVALVVGDEHTYGKGTIQSQTVTDDGGGSYFKVTVGKYYTVSGKTPEEKGVQADVIIPSRWSFDQGGEEFIDYPEFDRIEPAFKDSLRDIDPGLRPWYLRYYMPTLQERNLKWREQLKALQDNSSLRIHNNREYQHYLTADETEFFDRYVTRNHPIDPQHHEAINIVKDMIIVESRMLDDDYRVASTGVALEKDVDEQ